MTQLDRRRMLLMAGAAVLSGCGQEATAPAGAPTAPPSSFPRGDRLSYGTDAQQFAELRLPDGPGPHPVAVVIHGGYWRVPYNLDLMSDLSGAITAEGWATWNVEYRRVGDPGGGWPNTLLDVAAAADHLRTLAEAHRLDLGRVTAVGHSAGGHLALWLAGRRRIPPKTALHATDPLPIHRAISLAGVADLGQASDLGLGRGAARELLGGTPAEVPERYATASPAALLPFGPGVRQVLIHGANDTVVPPVVSEAYHKAAQVKGDRVELVPVPDVGHFEVIAPSGGPWDALRAALKK